jgi:hypothetical protein
MLSLTNHKRRCRSLQLWASPVDLSLDCEERIERDRRKKEKVAAEEEERKETKGKTGPEKKRKREKEKKKIKPNGLLTC